MIVKPHTNIQNDIAAWRRSLAPEAGERTRLAKHFWDEFVRSLTEADGPPAGAVPAGEAHPDRWWCPFPPCYVALVWFREAHRAWGLWSAKEAVVLELNFSPGLPG